jgi:putative spermidine/putrescine transport system ATP-binding protein
MSLAVEALSYRYGAGTGGIDGISLAIEPGEFCAVIGPSGCGKSTLLKLIAGFLDPAAGTIRIGGDAMAGRPPRARDLGVVFQNYALFPHMTALDNVAYPLKLRGMAKAERRRLAGEALERAGLSGFGDRLPGALSGGQQQRVALARALVFKPRALLLDEPLSALDAAHRAAMRDEIRSVQRAYNIATLHVTHDQEEALSIADRVAVLRDGKLLQVATPAELYDRPADRFVAGFVGAANLFDGIVRGGGRVETALGLLAHRSGDLADGSRVTVCFRPEALRIGDDGADGTNRFDGRIVRDRFLGSIRRFDFAVAGGVLLGETSWRGDVARLSLPPEAIRLIPIA